MNQIFDKSIKVAQSYLLKSKDFAHDFDHAQEVVNFSKKICKKVNCLNTDLIEVAAWWHDVGRLYNPIHEEISGKMARKNLIELGGSSKDADLIYEAIRFHKWNMNPTCLEGDIIRDSDKLQYLSVKRWKKCAKYREYEHIKKIIPLLPKLREILNLNVSKKIYDKKIYDFLFFIDSVKCLDDEFLSMINEVNSIRSCLLIINPIN